MTDEKDKAGGSTQGNENNGSAPSDASKTGADGKRQSKFASVSRADKLKFAALIGILLALLGVGLACIPYFSGLVDSSTREQTVQHIQSQGPWGVLIIIGLEIVQVIVAFIPGEVVQAIAGILYGTFGGWLICTIGIAISSVAIYKLVDRLGMPFVRAMVPESQLKRLDFLNGNKRMDFIVFILFFIPGLPKDTFTYLVPLTEMPLKRYLPLQLIARTPALLASTYAGSKFTSGEYGKMIAVFVICGALGILGIIFYDRIMAFFDNKKEKVKEKIEEKEEEKAEKKIEGHVGYDTHHALKAGSDSDGAQSSKASAKGTKSAKSAKNAKGASGHGEDAPSGGEDADPQA